MFKPQQSFTFFTRILCLASKSIFQCILLSVCFFAFPFILSAQEQAPTAEEQIAEQMEIIANSGKDSTRANAYGDLGKLYLSVDRDSAKLYFEKGIELSESIGFTKRAAFCHANLGIVYAGKSDFDKSFEEFETALNQYKQVDDFEGQARMLLNMGNIHEVWGDYRSALDCDFKGLAICDSIDYVYLFPQYHNNMGNLYYKIQDYENALLYFELADKSTARSGRTDLIPNVKLNLSGAAEKNGNFEKAYALAQEVIDLVDSIPNAINLVPTAYRRMAELARAEEKYERSLLNYQKMIDNYDNLEVGYFLPKSMSYVLALEGIGFSYLKLNDLKQAEQYLQKAYTFADSTDQLKPMSRSAKSLAEVKERLGKISEAYEYHKIYKWSADSLNNLDVARETAQLSVEHEYEMKQRDQELEAERQAANQKRKELIYIGVIAAGALSLVIIVLLYRLQRGRTEQAQLAKKNMKLDLDHKNRELASNVLYALKKNELLLDVSDKLKKVRSAGKADQQSTIDEVIQEIYVNSKDIGWEEFELRFKEVHSDFYDRLTEKFPNLTPNELRLSAFLKLNMTTKDISAITFQSEHSIVMARSRLKKKLGVQDDSLTTFLHKI